MHSTTVYVGLGSNLADPVSQVFNAYNAMDKIAATTATRLSPLYRSMAVGPTGQPDYVNAVAEIQTDLTPIQLLEALQEIEQQQQRVRIEHWGPRTIDLDILLYGGAGIDTPRLTVPHAYLHKRNFVLAPLHDLVPSLRLPNGDIIVNLLSEVGMADLTLMNPTPLGD